MKGEVKHMRKLIRFLFLSMSLLTLTYVLFIYITFSDIPFNLTQLKTTINTTLDNINSSVQKITSATINSDLADNIANLKSNLVILDGTGNLVTDDTKTGQNAAEVDSTQLIASPDSYNFSQEMYPFRAMLTPTQQSVYDLVYANAISLNPTFKVNVSLDKQGLGNVMEAIFNDNPELFWIETSYSYGYSTRGTVVSITLQFNETVNNFKTSKDRFDQVVNTVVAQASKLSSDLEKEKYVYKYLMNTVVYNENSVLNQSAYSALVNGSSVCAGYSRAFQYIMQQLGIPSYLCTGYANNGNHAWNIVKINGGFHNVDLSWDDSIGEAKNSYSFEYFNIPDSQISSNHIRRDMSVGLPACR